MRPFPRGMCLVCYFQMPRFLIHSALLIQKISQPPQPHLVVEQVHIVLPMAENCEA
ncbi:hypothetical protein BDV33DRAFT_186344 [Aspergillus novoparasiticus]|uniref:Uncharacterized protein n=1 Tax=Aspergillus novoparasiticus TaxID=986946 RepID=A0A5N6E6C1_9EURO|nr:hypothetical protein BDV33DRAFT_186344 [Aspergillus novoparasiticus]